MPVVFLWTHDLTLLLVIARLQRLSSRLGQYSWMPVWLPELFPTRIRATGDGVRVQRTRASSPVLGPLIAGMADRQLRRLRLCRHDRVACIYILRLVGGAVPAGDEGQAAAGRKSIRSRRLRYNCRA